MAKKMTLPKGFQSFNVRVNGGFVKGSPTQFKCHTVHAPVSISINQIHARIINTFKPEIKEFQKAYTPHKASKQFDYSMIYTTLSRIQVSDIVAWCISNHKTLSKKRLVRDAGITVGEYERFIDANNALLIKKKVIM